VLHAAYKKSRRGSNIPPRADLVADVQGWLEEKLAIVRSEAIRRGEAPPERLAADTPVSTVPAGLVRILDRDLKLAGIPKRDSRGWTVDVHALRHTFGTLLSKGNVEPRTAQAAMRHSSLDLTMDVYTDPQLLDVAGALERLPELAVRGAHGGGHFEIRLPMSP
jgi:integrase